MTNSTSKKLYLLIAIFIIGFLSLFTLNQVFLGFVNDLDKKTNNYKAKIQVGEYVSEDIFRIKSLFFELATTTTSKRSRKLIENRLNGIISKMSISLNILEKGGVLTRVIPINIAGHTVITKNTIYEVEREDQLSLEVIDIRPKLIELKAMIKIVDNLLFLRTKLKKEKDTKEFTKIVKKIRRFYKTTPAFFNRMSENIRRLLYESDIELKNLKLEIKKDKIKYMKIKMALIVLVIGIIMILGYWISSIINDENKQLIKLNIELENKELAVKAILNGQENIVIVSDGEKMIDANYAIIEFFNQFESLEEFKKEHDCICDLFKDNIEDETYIVNKDYDGDNWLEYVVKHPTVDFKVVMNSGFTDHHFSLSANKKNIDTKGNFIIVASFNDITSEINSQHDLEKLNNNLELIVEHKVKELNDLNENLEQKVIIETQKVRDKDKQMTQQARFAALGEMIGNIAHQWRQPLSAINTTASGMKLQLQLGLTNDKEVEESYGKIMGYVDFLTQTIEDFRGFFREDKEKIDFNMMDTLNKTLSITNATYKDNNIEIINECQKDENFVSHGMPSEISQVFLNILSNAKDAINDNKIKERFVHIRNKIENGFNVIYIQDNAGGIPVNILDKIFDPYFTTKHQSQGTGIGLYMSKDIIEKHMDGKLSVKNMSTTLDGKDYNGACFRIAIPQKN